MPVQRLGSGRLYGHMRGKPGVVDPIDYEFMEINPYGDSDFDEEHNKRVIQDTIKKHEAKLRKQRRDFKEKTKERAEAGAMFLKNATQGKGYGVEKYFGKKELARLRAQEVINDLKSNPALLAKLKKKLGEGRPL